jgi:hypothetical protein
MTRLMIVFAVVYALVLVVWLWSLFRLKGFLADTRDIADAPALERFKTLARAQMYVALVAIALLVVGGVASVALLARKDLVVRGVVLLVNAFIGGLGMHASKIEKQTRGLPASAALASEYRLVSERWVKKALPDF